MIMMKRYRNKYIIYLGGQKLPRGIYKLTKVFYDDTAIIINIYENDDIKRLRETITITGSTLEMLEEKLIKKKDLDNYPEYII